ncbi:MAG: hypothetical protein KDA57_23470, partial [Planctomycetales bacterium]|nr:hypothetical protein [Planctomycetales bacterium]
MLPKPWPPGLQRMVLPLSAVLIQALDASGKPIRGATASGFLRREGESVFLYTCWHVVTELNPNQLKVPLQLPERRSLGVTMTMISPETAALQTIG